MLKDVRLAIRMLLQAKGWALVILLSLAIGIGANTALFTLVNGLLLTSLPVSEPGTLVRVRYAGPNDMVTSSSDYGFSGQTVGGREVRATFSYSMYRQFVAENRTMTDLLACAPFGRVNVVVNGQAEIATAFVSTGNYYRLLGVSASLGRLIMPDDDRADAAPVAVISHRYWLSRFGGDKDVIGKLIQINDVPVTIIGVVSPEFTGIQQAIAEPPDVSVPFSLDSQLNTSAGDRMRLSQPTYWWIQVMGRLKPGATASQVQGNLEGMFQATARAGLDSYLSSLSESARSTSVNRHRTQVPRLIADSGAHGIYDVGTTELRGVTILAVVAALVLLIVCANVANLLLSRATARTKEISVRLSLGATRGRLIRQLLTESVLLATIGGALGVMVAYWGRQLLPVAAPIDWRVIVFVFVLSLLTGVTFGIAPAIRATGVNVNSALKENSRSVARARTKLSKGLLILQIAVSIVLLVGAGLFLRTLQNLRAVDVGFNPRNLVLFRINPQLNRYDDARIARLYADLMERLSAAPGVQGVSLSQPALLAGSINATGIFVEGRTYSVGDHENINRVVVSPSFFETLGITLRSGRGFTTTDSDTAPKVAVINEAAVRKYFPNEEPLGRHFGNTLETTSQFQIVGTVRDAKYNSLRDSAPPTMYVPYFQARTYGPMFEVRTAADPPSAMTAIREIVRQVDPNLPIVDMSTQLDQIEKRFSQEKVFAQACTLFGGVALLLAAIGLFGLMSYAVTRRTNEIGIRMALGAQRGDVLRMVLGESMTLALVGVGIGLVAAIGTSRLVNSLLFGLPSTDVVSIAISVVVMLVVSALAGYLPARYASRVDPMVAVRYE